MTGGMTKHPTGKDTVPAIERQVTKASGKNASTEQAQRGKAQRGKARGGEARAIADLVPAIGETAFRKFGFVQSSVITRWPEIVGEKLARVTAPDSLRFARGSRADGTLHISVTSAHASVVQHVIPDIIARVNRFFGYAAVARVQLKQGRTITRAAPVRPAAPPPLAQAASRQSGARGDALRAIRDPELRAVLDGLAHALATRDTPGKLR